MLWFWQAVGPRGTGPRVPLLKKWNPVHLSVKMDPRVRFTVS